MWLWVLLGRNSNTMKARKRRKNWISSRGTLLERAAERQTECCLFTPRPFVFHTHPLFRFGHVKVRVNKPKASLFSLKRSFNKSPYYTTFHSFSSSTKRNQRTAVLHTLMPCPFIMEVKKGVSDQLVWGCSLLGIKPLIGPIVDYSQCPAELRLDNGTKRI